MRVARSTGFPPVSSRRATVLVLGSLPSRKSIEAGEYYANPRNAFWRIMGELFGAGPELPYAERTARLTANGIALWDVLAEAVRPGSMDSNIDLSAAIPNDFAAFIDSHPGIRLICFNGRKSEEMFNNKVLSRHEWPAIRYRRLPSTSPAYASLSFEEKLRKWSIVRDG